MTIYIDDLHIFGPNKDNIIRFKAEISSAFKMTNDRRASYYLKMQIKWLGQGIFLYQESYARQILQRYSLSHIKPVKTPIEPAMKIIRNEEHQATDAFTKNYLSILGSINYLASKTRPDLAYMVSALGRVSACPEQEHLDAVTRAYSFLAGELNRGLYFQNDGDQELKGYVDSDFAGDPTTARSTTGYVFTLAGAPIIWKSYRQGAVSTSSTEAEYIAAAEAAKATVALKGLLNKIRQYVGLLQQKMVPLYIDNQSAIAIAKKPEHKGRTRHIHVSHHYIRELIADGDVDARWISSKENVADILTKPVVRVVHEELLKRLRLEAP